MKLPEIRRLERLLIAAGIPYRAIDFREGCKIVYQHQTESISIRITAAEYADSYGIELLDDNRIYSILTAEDVFAMIKEHYNEVIQNKSTTTSMEADKEARKSNAG
jgi:hypothetical protein